MSSNPQQWHGGLVDKTLTKEGVAACAKATGDAIKAFSDLGLSLVDGCICITYEEEE